APLAGKPLMLAAGGRLTVPALFAAALDSKIARLYLSGGLVSYRSIVETEEYNVPFANFVPGVLLHTDLPEVGVEQHVRDGIGKRHVVVFGLDGPAARNDHADKVAARPR